MTGRLSFDLMPDTKGSPPDDEWAAKLRRVLDASFRTVRSVLSAIRMREQFRCVDCVIDTGATPHAIVKAPGLKVPPLGVQLLRATNQRTPTGRSATGFGVQWEWRAGSLLIHSVDGLSASTRYDCVIAVLED